MLATGFWGVFPYSEIWLQERPSPVPYLLSAKAFDPETRLTTSAPATTLAIVAGLGLVIGAP